MKSVRVSGLYAIAAMQMPFARICWPKKAWRSVNEHCKAPCGPIARSCGAEALATTRFETPPGRPLQIDFGERLVAIGAAKIKGFVSVATFGHSRRR
jgi:hypothetical protein